VPIVIDGSGSEYATSDSDWHSFDSFLDAEVPAAAASGDEIEQLRLQAAAAGKAAAFSAAASRDEIEQLRLQAAAAARSYREARAAAARREAINQAAVAPPADAHGGLTADGVRADLRLILKSVLDIQKAIERMAARGI
jgi:hypothetical protein